MALELSEPKSVASFSIATYDGASGGRILWSTEPHFTPRNGDASTSSPAVTPTSTQTGRRITPRAIRAQAPRSGSASRRRRRMRPLSIRRPSSWSVAGRMVSEATIATSTAAIPPYPMDRRNDCGNTSSDDMAAATVRPEKSTVRPAVRMVVVSAAPTAAGSSTARRASSSRKRLTTKSA